MTVVLEKLNCSSCFVFYYWPSILIFRLGCVRKGERGQKLGGWNTFLIREGFFQKKRRKFGDLWGHIFQWYGLRVASYELLVTSYELKAQTHELKLNNVSSDTRVTSSNAMHEFKFTSYYEFKSTNYQFKNHLISKNSSEQP